MRPRFLLLWIFSLALCAAAEERPAAKTALAAHFQQLEQSLMDAIAAGDRPVWQSALAEDCVITSEEGEVLTRAKFLEELRPLPKGLAGGIAVKELTVQQFGDTAVVRFLADEWETVFGQRMTTKYRITDTYRREKGAWKMVASHTSVVTADPPAQAVDKSGWPGLAGKYRLLPDGWTLTVELRDGALYGGRDPAKLSPFVPLTDDAFVLSGRLGEWLFVVEQGKATRIVNLRKFETLIWTRVE
jgi:hypothetical protein